MAQPTISLCVISGNEAPHVLRFLDAFAPAFDQLCIVRAVGSAKHDKTIFLAKEWCNRNAKRILIGEYLNAPDTKDFPHVDDFAAARNQAWSMATGEWQFWADLDDVIAPESAALIRENAASGKAEYYFFKYIIRASGETNMRERLFKRGAARWNQPVHETCRAFDESQPYHYDERVAFSHEPSLEKERDPMRNRRIMRHALRHLDAFAVELHREYFYEWQLKKTADAAEGATKWAEIAQAVNTLPEQRFDTLLRMSELAREKDLDHAIDLCWSAARIAPWMREPWGCLAELELRAARPNRAVYFTGLMQSLKKPQETGFPVINRFYSWEGLCLRSRSLRAASDEAGARKQERAVFQAHGSRISLLHATRGRPAKALEARANWIKSAIDPLGVEHIFAVDSDDAESMAALKDYRRVVVTEPNGCVKAWNAAAAECEGRILVQLSDDWLPCIHWDELIWLALKEGAAKHIGTEPTGFVGHALEGELIGSTPLVLAVHDGHRKDALLCMAILTRARYERQVDLVSQMRREKDGVFGEAYKLRYSKPYLFSPDYFGVWSDNEFTFRAYKDGVVVQAQHINFLHQHPLLKGTWGTEWDETYRRQNVQERYAEGEAIYRRRNPDAP